MSQQITIPGPGDLMAERYRIVSELGRGSYGVVFEALDEREVGRRVAIKTLLPQSVLDREVIVRFEREAQLVSRLQHPNIILQHDYGQRDNLFYMVMEYIEGRSLDDLLKSDAPLPPQAAQALTAQILSALSHAHERGIVHRDLKPANILLQPTPQGGEQVKILDFGIAKALRDENQDLKTLTQAGHVLGTPHYMSPEQISGDEVDHRADLYSVGIILYELLVGEHPFEGTSSTAVMVAHLRDDPPPLPAPLERAKWGHMVRQALRKQPEDRIESAAHFLALLESESHAPIGSADETGEITSIYGNGYNNDGAAPLAHLFEDQGETQEYRPLSPMELGGAFPPPADRTMQWQRNGATPDFGAEPLPAAHPQRPAFSTQPIEAVGPERHSPSLSRDTPKRSRLPLLVGALLLVFLGLIAYITLTTPSKNATQDVIDSVEAKSPRPSPRFDRPEPAVVATRPSTQRASALARSRQVVSSALTLAQREATRVSAPDEEAPGAQQDASQREPSKEKPERQSAPSTVTLKITSNIGKKGNAVVAYVDGERVGDVPLTYKLKRSDKSVTVSVASQGYKRQTQTVKLDKNHTLDFHLDPDLMLELNP